jgi:predicted AlkP superfamily pyrophosphatase or phosphodiesterase
MSPAKVLVVGMDGVRFDRLVETRPPVLSALMARGGYGTSLLPYGRPDGSAATASVAYTDSGPGWSTIATGVWPDKHGVTGNDFANPDYRRYPDFLTRAKSARPDLATVALISWASLVQHGTFGAGADVLLRLDGDRDGYLDCDRTVAETARWCLRDQDPDALFVYFGATDEVAHELGPLGEPYRKALLSQDDHLGRLLDTIRSRGTYPDERWTVLVTTDHGHVDAGGHGGDSTVERQTFVIVAELDRHRGERLPNPRLVDVAPTVLHRLGVPLDPAWALDGTPL